MSSVRSWMGGYTPNRPPISVAMLTVVREEEGWGHTNPALAVSVAPLPIRTCNRARRKPQSECLSLTRRIPLTGEVGLDLCLDRRSVDCAMETLQGMTVAHRSHRQTRSPLGHGAVAQPSANSFSTSLNTR